MGFSPSAIKKYRSTVPAHSIQVCKVKQLIPHLFKVKQSSKTNPDHTMHLLNTRKLHSTSCQTLS